jgi:phytoene synthase
MCALYAFARTTDDLGDCAEPISLRTRWLNWWRQTVAMNLIGECSAEHVVLPEGLIPQGANSGTEGWPIDLHRLAMEIIPALRDSAQRYEIPTRYLLEIIDGVLADQQKTRFDTYEQVEHYCYLVASAVGLACIHIWEYEDPIPISAVVDCGLAFQLTNILRDVLEDAERGRIYLPRQHYEQHGLSEDDLLKPRSDDRLQCLVLDEVIRVRRLFNSGWEVWDSLHPDGRPMFSMMWRTYRQLLERIAESPRSIVQHRVSLTPRAKLGIISQHFCRPLFRRLPVPPKELGISETEL